MLSNGILLDVFVGHVDRGWALCDGQLLPIVSNEALFSILGTTYGGDGRSTFGLPDLRGHVPMHAGTGPGLAYRPLGSKGGAESNTLTLETLPTHNHAMPSQETFMVTAVVDGAN
jgi:microcystin-dependent protein